MLRMAQVLCLGFGLVASAGCDHRASDGSLRTAGADLREESATGVRAASGEAKVTSANAQSADASAVPVVVELFSSEGCSSCPAADEVLRELDEKQPISGVQVIPLEMHVDYWNDLGWADPFSSAALTQRQQSYSDARHASGVFTPEAVVDGMGSVVGSQRGALTDRIREAAQRNHVAVGLAVEKGALRISIPSAPIAAVDAWIAYAEVGLSTEVTRGENAGRTLRHAPVVRSLIRLGPATQTAFSVPLPDLPGSRDEQRAIVLLQSVDDRGVVGSAMTKL